MSGLAYELEGPSAAPAVVLVSSIGTTRAMWHEQVARLKQTHRVLTYDHPGHGDSEDPETSTIRAFARQLYAQITELEIETFALWGISMGGMVAMYIAAAHPDQVDRLVLSATALRFADPDPWGQRARTVREQGLESIADMVMSRYFSDTFRAQRPEVVERFRADLCACSDDGYARCCEALAAWDFSDSHRISAPTLVLRGSADSALPAELTGAVAYSIAGARLETISGAGHLLTVERPDETTEMVLDHLRP